MQTEYGDYYPNVQQIAFLFKKTGACRERGLNHGREAEEFYRGLKPQGILYIAQFPTDTRNLSFANATGPAKDARMDFRTAFSCPSTSGAIWLSNKRLTPLSRAASPIFFGGVCSS
jgi:hypothetical protein